MFVTLQNAIVNVEEIRNVSVGSNRTLWIYFKNPTGIHDHLSFCYDDEADFKKDVKALTEACEEYNKNKIKK